MVIDYIDGQPNSQPITITSDDIVIFGWAATEDHLAYMGIFVKYDNVFYPAEILPRPDVANVLNCSETDLGFKVFIPKSIFSEDGSIIEVIGVDSMGEIHYMTQYLNVSVI